MDLERILYTLPGIIVGLTVHECAHAWTAYKLGDPTAKNDGRITLNPLKHIDILGFIFLLVAGFGWAKPVMFNKHNLRNPRRDEILISIAGPLSNLLLSLLLVVIVKLVQVQASLPVLFLLHYGILINFVLFFFNMIPIPPLDGSHVLFRLLNISEEREFQIARYGTYLLIGILLLSSFGKINILPIGQAVNWFMGLFF